METQQNSNHMYDSEGYVKQFTRQRIIKKKEESKAEEACLSVKGNQAKPNILKRLPNKSQTS
jgi:hypothetical protein